MSYSEDADFVFHAIVFAKKIMFTNYVPYVYAYNGGSATNSTSSNIEKRHKKIRSNILMAKHLKEICHNCNLSKNLHPILKRWSNSIVVGEFLSLKKSFEDIAFFCRESNFKSFAYKRQNSILEIHHNDTCYKYYSSFLQKKDLIALFFPSL